VIHFDVKVILLFGNMNNYAYLHIWYG